MVRKTDLQATSVVEQYYHRRCSVRMCAAAFVNVLAKECERTIYSYGQRDTPTFGIVRLLKGARDSKPK